MYAKLISGDRRKIIKKYLPDIFILIGIWVFIYVSFFPIAGGSVVEKGGLPPRIRRNMRYVVTDTRYDYSDHFKFIGVVLMTIGIDIAIRKYLSSKEVRNIGEIKNERVVVMKAYAEKTFEISEDDAKKVISYACRYPRMETILDEVNLTLTVYTTFADNEEASSIADRFALIVISDEKPKMPREEYTRRVEGRFPEKS